MFALKTTHDAAVRAMQDRLDRTGDDLDQAVRLNGRLRGDIRRLETECDAVRANALMLSIKVSSLSAELANSYVRNERKQIVRHASYAGAPVAEVAA